MKAYSYIFCLLAFLFILPPKIFAQPPGQRLVKVGNRDTLSYFSINHFQFKNVNRIPYYYNRNKLLKIKKYYDRKDWRKMYTALKAYVLQFGVKNFYKETYLLWRLGKLSEQLGHIEEAKSLYRLVLKHHHNARKKEIRLYYDSLTTLDKDYYLPIEYYKNLVGVPNKFVDTMDVATANTTKMNDSINSGYSDYGPSITKRGKKSMMVFTSQRKRKEFSSGKVSFDENLYFSVRADSFYIDKESGAIDTIPWALAKPLKGINTDEYNEGSAVMSPDGKTVFFSRCESPDGYGNCDIFMAEKLEDGSYGNVQNLGPQINSISWDSHPALSHSGDTLFFASDRIGGFGMSDLYYTYKRGDGSWAPAQNMGPNINTRHSEVSPFYHPGFDILYFSSNGHMVNFGNFDIYKTYKMYGRWTEPRNVGPLVNHDQNEYYFAIDPKSAFMFFAKADTILRWDHLKRDSVKVENLNIHSYPLPMEAHPNATIRLSGSVKDSISGKAFSGIVSIIDLDNGIEIAPKRLRPDGSYDFELIKNNNYLVVITGEDFYRIEKEFLLRGDTAIKISTPSIKFRKWKFTSIEFKEGKADVIPDMEADLDKLVILLADHPKLGLKISGHTDSSGDHASNLKLSQDRADAIKKYIVDKGKFDPKRVTAIGYGDTVPIIKNEKNDEDKKVNRRVEFEIITIE